MQNLAPVGGGLDDRARVWQGTSGDGREWCVKATRRDNRFGLALAASLSELDVPGVLNPLVADSGYPWAEHRGRLVSVARWIRGEDAATSPVPLSWHDFGATLRAVHDHTPPTSATPTRVGIRRWSLPMDLLLRDVDSRLAQTAEDRAAGDILDAPGAALSTLWAEHRTRLARLARAERRLKRSRREARRVPLHGDPHLGNIVVGADRRPWLIDFDESTIAPREVDLMLVELGVIFSAPIREADRGDFRAGYGPVDIDEARITRFGCVRAIEDATATMLRLIDAAPADRTDLRLLLDGQLGPHGLVSLVEERLPPDRPAGGARSPARSRTTTTALPRPERPSTESHPAQRTT